MAALSELEVEEVFLSPGSRSQSLAIAAQQLHDVDRLTVRVRVDERSMAFTALGAARASGQPVAIITTSGTAVANLLPAVLEAHHSGVPLIVEESLDLGVVRCIMVILLVSLLVRPGHCDHSFR